MGLSRDFDDAPLLRAAFEMHQQLIRAGLAKPWDYPELDYSRVLEVWPTYYEDIKAWGDEDSALRLRQWERDNPPETRPPVKPTDWAALTAKPTRNADTPRTDWDAITRPPTRTADTPRTDWDAIPLEIRRAEAKFSAEIERSIFAEYGVHQERDPDLVRAEAARRESSAPTPPGQPLPSKDWTKASSPVGPSLPAKDWTRAATPPGAPLPPKDWSASRQPQPIRPLPERSRDRTREP